MTDRVLARALVAAGAIACMLAIVGAPAALRLPFGLLALFAPGWLLLTRSARAGPAIELLTLGVGVSLAIVVGLGLILVLTGIGVSAVSSTAALLVTSIALQLAWRGGEHVRRPPRLRGMAWATGAALFALVAAVATLELTPSSPSASGGPLSIGLVAHGGSDPGSPRVDVSVSDQRGQDVEVSVRVVGQDGAGHRFARVLARWTIRAHADAQPWQATVSPPADVLAQRLIVVVSRVGKGGLAAGPPLRTASVSL